MTRKPPAKRYAPRRIVPPRQLTSLPARTPRSGLAVKPAAAKAPPPPPPAPPKVSRLPLFAFAAIAIIGLAVSTGALMIHVMTPVVQTEFSDEILSKELVPVEIPIADGEDAVPVAGDGSDGTDIMADDDSAGDDGTPDVTRPAMMDLPGNPILVQRQQSVPRQVVKVEGDAAKAAAKLKIPGEIFRLTDSLSTPAGGLSAGVPGSQMGFAFNQTDDGEADGSDAATPAEAEAQDASVVTVNSDDDQAFGPNRTIMIKTVDTEMALSDLLVSAGFDAEMAKEAEAAAKRRFAIDKLTPGYGVAAIGYRPDADASAYVPAQVALYKDNQFVRALARTDSGNYEEGANPWLEENIFQDDGGAAPAAKLRLLDVIYSAAVRNKLSTTVAGEIILLLSRNHDLEQPANGTESLLVLFGSKARDKKSGLGRVLYVKVDRGSEDSMECFAFQPAAKGPFDCVAGNGEGAVSGGMVTPVRGVIATKFGPYKDPVTKKRRMNLGVDWVAQPGSAVVAAYAGKVIFAGQDDKLGNIVKLAHEGGQVTVYTSLKTIASGMTEGRVVRAGQRLGTVGQAPGQKESRLHFELQRNGEPADPFGEYQARVEKGGAIETLVYRITTIESGNNCKAANPLSSAVGLGQFIKSTWFNTIRKHRPDLVAGRTPEQILALRLDCAIALEMTTALTRENASYIRSFGHPVTPGNLYLAHFLGPGGAVQALGASSGNSVLSVFGSGVVNANPFLRNFTTTDLINWAAKKMAGKGKAPVIAASTAQAKAQSFASNEAFVKFKEAVASMLN